MPCDSGMSYSSGPDYEARRQVELLTRVSCDIMQAIEKVGISLPVSGETAQWWDSHKEIDRKREEEAAARQERERVKAEALAKLTPEERAAIGIRA